MPPALAAVLALTACTSGGSVSTSSSSSAVSTSSSSSSSSSTTSSSPPPTSASSSPTYVPVKPAFPAAAKPQTLDSAAAFVTYFYELANYSYTKPEDGLLGPLGTSTCRACANYEREAVNLVAKHRRYLSEVVTVDSVTVVTTSRDHPFVIVTGEQNEVPILETDGRLTPAAPRLPINFRVQLQWTAQGWRVAGVANA